MSRTRRLIPDLGEELCHALERVEGLLVALEVWENDPDLTERPPAPLAERVALDALNRVQAVIAPTQSRFGRQASASGRQLLDPAGYPHRPLRMVCLELADLVVLGATAVELGWALTMDPGGELAEAITEGAQAVDSLCRSAARPVALVEALSRAHGLLTLADTADTTHLATLIVAADGDTDVVLDAAGEEAYTRTADRFNAIWARGDDLDRHLY